MIVPRPLIGRAGVLIAGHEMLMGGFIAELAAVVLIVNHFLISRVIPVVSRPIRDISPLRLKILQFLVTSRPIISQLIRN